MLILVSRYQLKILQAQGASMKRVVVDMCNNPPPPAGAVYTALSRVTSIDGLFITRFDMKSIRADVDVHQHMAQLRQGAAQPIPTRKQRRIDRPIIQGADRITSSSARPRQLPGNVTRSNPGDPLGNAVVMSRSAYDINDPADLALVNMLREHVFAVHRQLLADNPRGDLPDPKVILPYDGVPNICKENVTVDDVYSTIHHRGWLSERMFEVYRQWVELQTVGDGPLHTIVGMSHYFRRNWVDDEMSWGGLLEARARQEFPEVLTVNDNTKLVYCPIHYTPQGNAHPNRVFKYTGLQLRLSWSTHFYVQVNIGVWSQLKCTTLKTCTKLSTTIRCTAIGTITVTRSFCRNVYSLQKLFGRKSSKEFPYSGK